MQTSKSYKNKRRSTSNSGNKRRKYYSSNSRRRYSGSRKAQGHWKFGGHFAPRKSGSFSSVSRDKYVAKAEEVEEKSIYVSNQKFSDFNLVDVLKNNINTKGYENPTKIQSQAIPHILNGKDLIGLANTGSGKTAAFLIPLVNKAIKDKLQKCLIVTPTRELAGQIQSEFVKFTQRTNLRSVLIIGGRSIKKQIHLIRRRPQFVIGTPGRLKDLIERKSLNLNDFQNIVLDEVDRMLDMGFIHDIRFIISNLRKERQSLFFSATMSRNIEAIANSLLNNPVKVEVEKQSPVKSVDQDIVKVKSSSEKVSVLEEMLKKDEFKKVLIFSRTKRSTDWLSTKLYRNGFKADSIHGDKTQARRSKVISRFKYNEIRILVATDVAARGLDIPNITHVINYDEPANYEDYIHRIGRTGRVGKKGKALTFVH